MTRRNAGPRRLPPDTTPSRLVDPDYDTPPLRGRQPAYCELHGVNLVHRLPPRCPLSTADPLETLGKVGNAAWGVLGRGVHGPELPSALALLDATDVCTRCLDRLSGHPIVRQLRAGKVAA